MSESPRFSWIYRSLPTQRFLTALSIPESYLSSFNTFVLLMLYFLVPWTAVNLVDFYFVRKGKYAISEIFNPSGIYGLWSKPGLMAYTLGLIAMIPFMSLSFYVGPIARVLGGADVAFVVGLLVASAIYWVMARQIDAHTELRMIEQSESMLEGDAA